MEAEEDSEESRFARRILHRKNHSVLYESSVFADMRDNRRVQEMHDRVAADYSDLDFWVDKSSVRIHDFFSEGDEEGEELKVTQGSREHLLTKYSKIIARLPKKFHVCRLYVALKDGEGKLEKTRLDNLKARAEKTERSEG